MPSWVTTEIRVNLNEQQQQQWLGEILDQYGALDFNRLVPLPESLPAVAIGVQAIAHWGTKWSPLPENTRIFREPEFITLRFETAWGHPWGVMPVILGAIRQGAQALVLYAHEGWTSCGVYSDGPVSLEWASTRRDREEGRWSAEARAGWRAFAQRLIHRSDNHLLQCLHDEFREFRANEFDEQHVGDLRQLLGLADGEWGL